MGLLDKLLGRGKKAASEVEEMADKVGDKIEDFTDRDKKDESPPAPTPPSPPAGGMQGGSGGGGGAS